MKRAEAGRRKRRALKIVSLHSRPPPHKRHPTQCQGLCWMKDPLPLSIQSPILRAPPSQDQKARQLVTIIGSQFSYPSDLSLPPAILQAPRHQRLTHLDPWVRSQTSFLPPLSSPPETTPPPVLLEASPRAPAPLFPKGTHYLALPVFPSGQPWNQPSTSIYLPCHHFGPSFQSHLPGPLQMHSNQLTWIHDGSLPIHFPQHKK